MLEKKIHTLSCNIWCVKHTYVTHRLPDLPALIHQLCISKQLTEIVWLKVVGVLTEVALRSDDRMKNQIIWLNLNWKKFFLHF